MNAEKKTAVVPWLLGLCKGYIQPPHDFRVDFGLSSVLHPYSRNPKNHVLVVLYFMVSTVIFGFL